MKRTICIILIVAFAALFGTSVYFIFDHYRQETKQAELYDSLADMVDSAAEEEPAEPILFTEEKTVLPELAKLYQQKTVRISFWPTCFRNGHCHGIFHRHCSCFVECHIYRSLPGYPDMLCWHFPAFVHITGSSYLYPLPDQSHWM